ncbi:putative microsomal signal peptidase Spc12 [Aaosphaeria arxii CBS 175.79]|uniref:Signal peptidase complex subunit 1 n=1 Tax=Aaosphaeria arxii CBS 175.79 TaxID=1450172 RepID=A0A6A5X7C7_9PLEO|nr:putative microsomal signal peptidase Spc12 [Aaosphaeria arxii CBS 175.79]KAF2008832.1 putative microsomal signal peptidase Spc12 [Aaosphaeria arxii CBS 175.79]
MDALLDPLRDALEGQIDFEGQRLAELLTTFLLGLTGIVAFFAGFMKQDIALSLWVGLAGTAATFAAVVPPWGFYRRNGVEWLSPLGGVKVTVS